MLINFELKCLNSKLQAFYSFQRNGHHTLATKVFVLNLQLSRWFPKHPHVPFVNSCPISTTQTKLVKWENRINGMKTE